MGLKQFNSFIRRKVMSHCSIHLMRLDACFFVKSVRDAAIDAKSGITFCNTR